MTYKTFTSALSESYCTWGQERCVLSISFLESLGTVLDDNALAIRIYTLT